MPFNMTYSCILQNQMAAAFFMLLGILVFIDEEKRNPLWKLFAGALVGAGNLLRPEGIVILAAVFAWWVFSCLSGSGSWKRATLSAVLFAAAYYAVFYACEAAVVFSE